MPSPRRRTSAWSRMFMSLFETVDRKLGRPTALVNNAARLESQMRLDSMDAARLHRMFATNAIGTMLCSREAVRRMSLRTGGQGGNVVNVSSGAARYGSSGEYVDYAAAKGGSRDLHRRSGQGSCDRGRSSQWRPAWFHLYGTARRGRRTRSCRSREDNRPDAPWRTTGRSRRGDPVASFTGSLLCHRYVH